MTFHARCLGCGEGAHVDCACPPGVVEGIGGHLAACPMFNVGNQVVCAPDSDCCQDDHGPGGHDEAANACPTDHQKLGHACPHEAGKCHLWKGVKAHHELVRASMDAPARKAYGAPPEECPGGHCGLGAEDCTVCRPIVIEALGGSAQLSRAVA